LQENFAAVFYFCQVDKQAIRKLYLQKRKSLSPEQVAALSEKIFQNSKKLSFEGVKYLHIFYPITGKQEINSLLLAGWIRSNHPEIKLLLPKSDLQNHTLEHIVWEEDTPLAMNEWGITEPENGEAIQPGLIDMVIIPLLAFDKAGNRIGYGKGFYDRFLAECRLGIKKVGVSYFDAENVLFDADEYDIPLDICVTPERIWEF